MLKRRYEVLVAACLGFTLAGCCDSMPAKPAADRPAPAGPSVGGKTTGPAAAAATKPGAATRPQLPDAVEKAVRSLYAKARFHKIERTQTLGVDVYTVHLARLATKVVVTADGRILMVGRQVNLRELPKAISQAVTRHCGESQVRVTLDEVRAEIRGESQPAVVEVAPARTVYEVQVMRASDPKYHKAYLRLDKDGQPLK